VPTGNDPTPNLTDPSLPLHPSALSGFSLPFCAASADNLTHRAGRLIPGRGYAARLALIVHCLRLECNEVNGEDLDGESIDRAARLIAYFRSHCLKVHAALGSDSEIEDARRVLHWIEREQRTEFKRWEVHKDIRNAGRFARLEDLDPPLERLVKQGYLRRKPQAQKERGRPADPVFEVNPTCRRENRANRVNAMAE
jgi:hypothetical protein